MGCLSGSPDAREMLCYEAFLLTASNSARIISSGFLVKSDTTTITMQAKRNAGSSS
jgi:hypothetical protein